MTRFVSGPHSRLDTGGAGLDAWPVRIWLSIVLAATLACGATSCTSGESSAEPSGDSVADLPPLEPYSYKAGAAGLEEMMNDLFAATAKGDKARARMLAASWELDDAKGWYGEIFGTSLGPSLAAEYKKVAGSVTQLATIIGELQKDGLTRVEIEEFASPDDPAAVEYQSLALKRMIRATPLYSVRLASEDGSKTFHLWSFVYSKGLFRWIGKTKALTSEAAQGKIDPREYRIRDRKRIREILQN